MRPEPDPHDPTAYLPWKCELCVKVRMILIVVLEDEVARSLILRNAARKHDAHYLSCRRTRSNKQFLLFLAEGMGIDIMKGDTYTLWQSVKDYLSAQPRPVFLDNAEVLTPSSMRTLLSLHKQDDHLGRELPLVLASGQRRFLKVIEAVDDGAYFTSHCMFYAPGCEPTNAMRARADLAERVDEALASPIIPFPSTNEKE